MFRFLAMRLIYGIVVVWAVASLTFLLMHVVPGGPFDTEKKFPPEILANIRAKYHLDQPLWRQYVLYLKDLGRLRFGPSFKYRNRQVEDILGQTFPVSIYLGFWALLMAVGLGLCAGVVSALKHNRVFDRASMLLATLGISLPSFVLATLLIYLVAHRLKILPPALLEDWRHYLLPAASLAAGPAAYLARLSRSSFLETLSRPFVDAARARGIYGARLVLRHLLKNSLSPVVTVLGPLVAMLITGSFVIEKIFSIPGMGRYFITAVTNRDYPLIMAVTIVYAALIVVMNLLVDIAYAFLDPRVRLK
jgi:oligopeptide transport system permease protein